MFRDPKKKENLWWTFAETEKTSIYSEGRYYLEKLGYTILSVTGDGFGGIRAGFKGILFQMCHVHMERIITKGTTKNPKLEAGEVLLALIKTLPRTDSKIFEKRFKNYLKKYSSFLNEKTTNIFTGETYYTHPKLRSSALSLITFLPYLFTYEKDSKIPKTSNSIEGHFSHIKDIVKIHRGLSISLKQKVLHTILLASSIAPSNKKLEEIL